MRIRIKKLDERARIPKRGSEFSAGADLSALLDAPLEISAGETAFIGTGLAAEIPEGFVGLVFARSGLSCKQGLAPANKVGVIDSDYRGEIKVALYNHSGEARVIEPFERIAQLVVTPFVAADYVESDELDDTARGSGGFGSTGT